MGVILLVKILFYVLKIIIPCCPSCSLDSLRPTLLSFMLFFMYSIENLEILAKKIQFFSKKPCGVPRNPSFPVWSHCFRKKWLLDKMFGLLSLVDRNKNELDWMHYSWVVFNLLLAMILHEKQRCTWKSRIIPMKTRSERKLFARWNVPETVASRLRCCWLR